MPRIAISNSGVRYAPGLPPPAVTHFVPSAMPDEGLGVLLLIRIVEQNTPQFFRPDRAIHVARAPGRLPVIGGLATGESTAGSEPGETGPVAVHLPTAEAACVAVQRRDDEFMRVWSPAQDDSRTDRLSVRLQDLGLPNSPIDYDEARAFLWAAPRDRWIAHVLGGVVALARELGHELPAGFEMLVTSDIPEGRGAGSSSALQIAALRAIAAAFEYRLTDDDVTALAQRIDRDIVHAPTSAGTLSALVHARAGQLAVSRGERVTGARHVEVPADLEFVGLELGFDSGLDSGFGPAAAAEPVSAAEAAAESERAARFVELLGQPLESTTRQELGDLLFASHDCRDRGRGQSSDRELGRFVVDFARERRAAGAPLIGATMAGRGAIVVLGDQTKAWYEALRLKKALREKTGHSGHVFRYSSPGAAAFGGIRLDPVGS